MKPWLLLVGLLGLLSGCGKESHYHQKGGRWHYDGVPVNQEAGPVGFQPLGDYFAKDSRTGYYRGVPVHAGGAPSDGPSFEALNRYYARDRGRVYYCDTHRDGREYWTVKRIRIRPVAGADPATFRMLDDGYTARDRQHVFDEDRVVPVRDVETYQPLEGGFARDKVRGYYNHVELPGSDGARFQVLEGGYAADGAKAYYRGTVITTKDVHTLQALPGMGYAKTRNQVFHYGELVRGADAATFVLAEPFNGSFDASDKSGPFRSGQRVAPP